MKRGLSYFIAGLLILGIILLLNNLNLSPTGLVIMDEYSNESECVTAGYVWADLVEQNCTIISSCVNETVDCEPCLEHEDINGSQGECLSWTSCEEEICDEEEVCEEIVVGGQCIGDICDSENLDLCITSQTCEEAGGYWYGDLCNLNECISEEQCDEGYECVSESCIEVIVDEELDEIVDEENDSELVIVEQEPIVEFQEPTPSLVTSLSSNEIQNIKINPGDSFGVNWEISNDGNLEVNNCVFNYEGEFNEWIFYASEDELESINLAPGEVHSIYFEIDISEEVEEGQYEFEVSLQCSQITKLQNFLVEVEIKKIGFEIVDVQRTRLDNVRIIYSLSELIGENQEIQVDFLIYNNENEQISNKSENKNLKSNSIKEYKINLPINESVEGEMNLEIFYNSEKYSSSVREPIVLGAPISGFTIFDEIGTGSVFFVLIVIFVLVLSFFIIRKIRASKKFKKIKQKED